MNAPLNNVRISCPSNVRSLFRVGWHARGYLSLLPLLVAGPLFAVAPPNDDFASADEISGMSGSIGGTTVDATKEGGEPDHGLNIGGNSIWYVWQAPASGTAVFDTLGSTFDTTMGIYTGANVGALTPVAQGDDAFDYYPFVSQWWAAYRNSLVRFTVQAGVVYHIAIDGYFDTSAVVGDTVLNWQVVPRPANNNFANARVLPGDTGFLVAENAGATKETGEPNHAGNSGGASIWFRWTPTISGTARIFTSNSLTPGGTAMDTMLAVYTGTSIGSLTTIAANDNNGTSLRSLVNFAAQSGTTYWIAVDGKNQVTNIVTGKIAVSWTVGIAAGNNSFANARVLNGNCGLVKGNTFSATKEGGEPNHAGDVGGASVWFSWTAPESGPAVFTALGSPFFDTIMGAYTGDTINGLMEVASNDDVAAGFLSGLLYSRLEFVATAGITYRIAIDGYRGANAAAAQGIYFLSWGNGVPPNDEFFASEILTGLSGSVQGCNFFATKEAGEPNHAGNSGGHSIWYQWTPSDSGVATISLESSTIDTLLAVYTGDPIDALTLVAQNDDINVTTWQSRVRFVATAGTTYQIAVDGSLDGISGFLFDGAIQLDYSLAARPTLQITRTGGNVTINWSGPFRLQSTDVLANPSETTVWTDVLGFAPVTLPIDSAGNQFFRAIFP